MNKRFKRIVKMTQPELKAYVANVLRSIGYTVVSEDGFVYAKGTEPYLLTAHMDTVHKEPVRQIREVVDKKGNHVISSPQGIGGDDRCGVFMILEILKERRPSVLFCEDEEIGGVGALKFCATKYIDDLKELKFLVELDRMNANDAVFYECDNPEFTEFVEKATGFKEAWGTFSDISELAPACGVAAVNLSCGYYKQHTTSEYVVWEETVAAIEATKKLITAECDKPFVYIEVFRPSWKDGTYGWFDYDDKIFTGKGYGGGTKKEARETYPFEIWFMENGEENVEVWDGVSPEEALGYFMMEHDRIPYRDIIDIYG